MRVAEYSAGREGLHPTQLPAVGIHLELSSIFPTIQFASSTSCHQEIATITRPVVLVYYCIAVTPTAVIMLCQESQLNQSVSLPDKATIFAAVVLSCSQCQLL